MSSALYGRDTRYWCFAGKPSPRMELAGFSALFGPLERIVRTDWASPVRPEVGVISNLKDGQGKPIGGLGDGEIQWHSDQSYMQNPATGAML